MLIEQFLRGLDSAFPIQVLKEPVPPAAVERGGIIESRAHAAPFFRKSASKALGVIFNVNSDARCTARFSSREVNSSIFAQFLSGVQSLAVSVGFDCAGVFIELSAIDLGTANKPPNLRPSGN